MNSWLWVYTPLNPYYLDNGNDCVPTVSFVGTVDFTLFRTCVLHATFSGRNFLWVELYGNRTACNTLESGNWGHLVVFIVSHIGAAAATTSPPISGEVVLAAHSCVNYEYYRVYMYIGCVNSVVFDFTSLRTCVFRGFSRKLCSANMTLTPEFTQPMYTYM